MAEYVQVKNEDGSVSIFTTKVADQLAKDKPTAHLVEKTKPYEPSGTPDPGQDLGGFVESSTVGQVLDYVGEDPDRGAAALAAEQAQAKPRASLVSKLEQLIG